VRYLAKKISAPSQTVATAWIAPKICRCEPPTFGSQKSRFHPHRFTFGGVIAECVKAVLLALKVFPWFASNTFKANNNQWWTLLFSIFYFPSAPRVMALNMLRLHAKLGEWAKLGGFRPSFLLGALSGNRHSSASFGDKATSCGIVSRL